MAITKEVAATYPTVASVEAAGYRRAGPYSPGLGAHYTKVGPNELNSDSQGTWIAARVSAADWPIANLDVSSALLDGVPASALALTSGGAVRLDATEVAIKFPRTPFASRPDGVYDLAFVALTTDGAPVAGLAELSIHGSSLALHRLHSVRNAAGRTEVVVSLDQTEDVSLDVIDLQGRVVARLERGTLGAGIHRREWPRTSEQVARGSYFVRLRRAAGEEAVKLIVTH